MLAAHGRYIATMYAEHHAPLVRWLTAITRDPNDAEDLAHEAFFRLAREIGRGRQPDDPTAWLHRAAWNLAMSRGRHRSVVNRRDAELPRPEPTGSPEHEAIQAEVAGALRLALQDLSTVERGALVLAARGYPGGEIAGTIGRTPGATRTLLCRARSKVRLRLELAGFGAS